MGLSLLILSIYLVLTTPQKVKKTNYCFLSNLIYRALHVLKLFIGSLNIGPTWTKNSDAKKTDAKNTDAKNAHAKNTDAIPKR